MSKVLLEELIVVQLVKNSLAICGTQNTSPSSQDPAMELYPQPDEFNKHLYIPLL
jgi:hypothetical protein